MGKWTVIHPDDGISFSTEKELTYQDLQRHGGNFNIAK